jgi:hypothetical protein
MSPPAWTAARRIGSEGADMNTASHIRASRPLSRRRLLALALGASLIPLLMAAAPRLHAAPQSESAQTNERGAPPPTVPPTTPPPVNDQAADAIDHARDGLPPPQTSDEAPMTSPRPPPAQSQGQGMANTPQPTDTGLWAQLDSNRDGKVSASEGRANADFSTRFASMDTDRDGFVSEGEYRAHAKGMDEGKP